MIRFQVTDEPVEPGFFEALADQLQALGWIDKTALGVLVVFFVLGLFKGFIWQVSRIGILVAAYFVAGRFGHDVAGLLGSAPPERLAGEAGVAPEAATGETTLYIAYCVLFVAVLIVLSLLAMLLKKLADKAGLGFFDRLGGGVLGVATGALVVLFGVFVVRMFFPQSELAQAAEGSHSLRFSQRAIEMLDDAVNDDLRTVLALRPLDGPLPSEVPAPFDPDRLTPTPDAPSIPAEQREGGGEAGEQAGGGGERGGVR
ncbi:MAG: CvpA family protein [Planctomycetes bacterium]|nr:CvpA family protein [Planctomycetota bacterium]